MSVSKRGYVLLFSLALTVQITWAQSDLDKLLQNSVDDGKVLMKGYLDPFMKSLSLGLNQGWYNTAKTHKPFGFDLTVTVNAMIIPSSALQYDISKLNLKEVELDPDSPDAPYAPTFFGSEQEPTYRLQSDPNTTYNGPGGIDIKETFGNKWLPVPMATLGIGLPKDIDLKIRFTPALDIGDGKFKLFGIGVMHNVKQYIPGLKLMPFDLSAFVGYTRMTIDYKYDGVDPAGENQRGEFAMSATTIQGLISKKFSVLTVYGGAGYNIAKSNIAVKGTYDFNGDTDYDDAGERDPVDLKFAASGPRVTAGFRLKFAVFTLHGEYTLQKYSSFTGGFGINVR